MKNLKIVFLSDWLGNPYKDLLSTKLATKGAEVKEYLWSTFFTPSLFKSGKPNILHLHTLHPFLRGRSSLSKFLKVCLFVGQICFLRLIGIKTVWTVHEWVDKLNTGSSEINKNYCTIIGKILHRFIVHSNSTKEEIIEAFNLKKPNKANVIPHGNYIESYENKIDQKEARKYLEIPEDNFVFLIFGGLYRYKGVIETVQAFKQLNKIQTTLIIAGKPNEEGLKEEIESEIKGLEKSIVFIPSRIPDNEIQIYMNACDCVVVSYKVFTTSGVAILASSFGRSCIAPKDGFFLDLFKEGGAFLYDAQCSDGLNDALVKAVQNRELISQMGQANLALAQRLSWDDIASKTLLAYQ